MGRQTAVGADLFTFLTDRAGPGTATNHAAHESAAEEALQEPGRS